MKLLVIGKEGKLKNYIKDEEFYKAFDVITVPTGSTDDEILAAGKDSDVILADAISKVSKNVIDNMPNLKMIHSEGVSFNQIDIEAAKAKHVYVCNCKSMNASAVAEQTLLLMLGLLRDVVNGHFDCMEGRQLETKENFMVKGNLKELGDCKVGLVGFGDIAKYTAKFVSALGGKVCYYDVFRAKPEVEAEYGVEFMPLDELLANCDIISMHVPVIPSTMHMANAEFFAKMKDGAYFINTARGELMDAMDLLDAIRSGHIAGAGIDTIEGEPVQKDNPILLAEPEVEKKIIYSCHVAGITASSFRRGYEMVYSDLMKVYNGQEPDRIVNKW